MRLRQMLECHILDRPVRLMGGNPVSVSSHGLGLLSRGDTVAQHRLDHTSHNLLLGGTDGIVSGSS